LDAGPRRVEYGAARAGGGYRPREARAPEREWA
jgi:hypothetical protein